MKTPLEKSKSKPGLSTRAEVLLEKFELKKTDLRLQILETFLKSDQALSQKDLIEALEDRKNTIDRVSIYRNLNHLKTAGLVHEVETNSYVSCTHECSKHPHVLLYCQNCQKHNEVKDHAKIEKFFDAVGGFKFFGDTQPFFMTGICQTCTETK